MGDSLESTNVDPENQLLGSSTGSLDSSGRKVRPPNKKRYEEELEALQNTIKEKEAEHRSITQHLSDDTHKNGLRTMRSEKSAFIDRLKHIEQELKNLNSDISKKKAELDRLQSSLHYKSEDRIDHSITRLDSLLKKQNFKLSEEKKIVSEIDSLKRSKKVLRDFLALKKENDDMRSRQKCLREERDNSQKLVNQLRRKEEEHKGTVQKKKFRKDTLKKELDNLYDMKRRLVQDFKQQEKDYVEVKGESRRQKRKEIVKKKEEPCSQMEAFQKSLEEYTLQREPYTDEINLCNTLIYYLQKYIQSSDDLPQEDPPVSKSLNLSSSNCSAELAAELEEGIYVLKRKTEDDSEYPGTGRRSGKRRPSKKGKRLSSVTKPVTHTPQIFSQFASLNLNAPSNHSEIPASLEQLQARKEFYKNGCQPNQSIAAPAIEEHHTSDAGVSTSDAGISLTESGMCEMSRQASNTESTENPTELPFSFLDELVKLSSEETVSETMSEVSEDTLGRSNSNSDSTEHAHSEGDLSDGIPTSGQDKEKDNNSDIGAVKVETASVSIVGEKCETAEPMLKQTKNDMDKVLTNQGAEQTKDISRMQKLSICDTSVSKGSKVREVVSDDCQETDYEFDMPPETSPCVS
ncbi:centromere-associated protein E-like [Pecten maximus]|uniref:centromere-associated protein E-like n=1 Tax=Pecten maximus TaxID=6579 RepID=UPI0014580F30|nr:centromere-associated protein E-like [Pecten maximus]